MFWRSWELTLGALAPSKTCRVGHTATIVTAWGTLSKTPCGDLPFLGECRTELLNAVAPASILSAELYTGTPCRLQTPLAWQHLIWQPPLAREPEPSISATEDFCMTLGNKAKLPG